MYKDVDIEYKNEKVFLTPKDLGEILQLSNTTIYKLLNVPGFPVSQVGDHARIPYNAFQRYMDTHRDIKF